MAGLDVAAVTAIYDALVSHASGTGLFSSEVLDHEPLNAPGTGLSCAIMMGPLVPVGRASGLGKTSGRLEFTAQVATPMTQLPAGGVDREMLQAAAVLLAAYSGDFELVTGEIAEGLIWMDRPARRVRGAAADGAGVAGVRGHAAAGCADHAAADPQ